MVAEGPETVKIMSSSVFPKRMFIRKSTARPKKGDRRVATRRIARDIFPGTFGESLAASPLFATRDFLKVGDNFPIGLRADCVPDREVNIIADEPHRAVSHDELGASSMETAEKDVGW